MKQTVDWKQISKDERGVPRCGFRFYPLSSGERTEVFKWEYQYRFHLGGGRMLIVADLCRARWNGCSGGGRVLWIWIFGNGPSKCKHLN